MLVVLSIKYKDKNKTKQNKRETEENDGTILIRDEEVRHSEKDQRSETKGNEESRPRYTGMSSEVGLKRRH